MNIECKLKRDGGTRVDMGTAKYHFAPREDGAHVAEVLDEVHQDRFLSITEGYRMYRGEAAAAPVSAPATAEQPALEQDEAKGTAPIEFLLGSGEHPTGFTIHGTVYALGDIVALAHTASGLNADEWNSLAEESRADMIDEELDKLKDPPPPAISDDDLRTDLVAQFEAKFGKKPHHNAGIDTIRAKLAEA